MENGKDRINELKRAKYDPGTQEPYDEFTMYTINHYAFITEVKNAEGFEVLSTIRYNDEGNPTVVEGPEAKGDSEKEYFVWDKNRIVSYTDASYFTTIYTNDDYGNKISETDYNEVNKRSKVHRYDILISMIGTVGNLYLVQNEEIKFAIKNIGLFKTSERLDLYEYIYCYLNTPQIKHYI